MKRISEFCVSLKSVKIFSIGRSAVALLLVSSAYFVGGVVFALILLSSLLIAETMSQFLGTALAICTGIIFSLVGILVEFMILVPVLRSFGPTRTFLFKESWIKPFEARETVFEHLVELNRFGAVLIAAIPIAAAVLLYFKLRTIRSQIHFNSFIALIVFGPLLIAALRKARDPISYVVSTASGDGRNFFLHVQRIRVTSGFTSFQNFLGQGDFGASLSSMVSDGMGSDGLFRFDDQYSIAAMYVLFAVLIASSAAAIVTGLAGMNNKSDTASNSAVLYAVLIMVTTLCVQMPWVMNEMFRSGFFSTVAAMSLCAVFVATCLSEVSYRFQASMLLSISFLIFATYQISAIYPLFTLLLISFPVVWRLFHTSPIRVVIVIGFLGLLSLFLFPKVINQMRPRLMLEGAITYLSDSMWLPISIAGALMILARGKLRIFGIVVFVAGSCTYGFQHLARVIRVDQGQAGYGYYGAKLGYIGLFIILLIVISGIASAGVSNLGLKNKDSQKFSSRQRYFSFMGAIGVLILANSVGKNTLPAAHNFYQGGQGWTQPSSGGLELALSYWDHPQVLFAKVTDPGNDRIMNFWHPYFWDGDPWNWAYMGNSDDPIALCAFIGTNDVLILTIDPIYAQLLRQTCLASVKVL
jgi:hypothetical protein